MFLVFKCRYLLKFNWFEQKKVHFVYSKQNLRPKNRLLEIGASNLEVPLLKFQYSSLLFWVKIVAILWICTDEQIHKMMTIFTQNGSRVLKL